MKRPHADAAEGYSQAILSDENAMLRAASDASGESFRALVDGLPEGVLVHRAGRVEYANIAAHLLLRYEPGALAGLSLDALVHPEERPLIAARVRALYEGAARLPPVRERLLRSDGSVIVLEVSPLRLVFRGEPAVVVVARDMSERERLQAQLVLADRMASVGRLAAGVAHEINNPLTYVLLHLDAVERALRPVLEDGPEPDRATLKGLAQRVRQAIDGADRVRKIVRDLRAFSHTDDEARGPVDLRRALDAAADMAAHEVKHRARLVRDYDMLPSVLGSEGRLSQVFLNLVVNAAHAIPEGAPEQHEVRVGARVEGSFVKVTVQDTGVGIAPEHLPRLFEPFFTTKGPGAGSGLGLSIVHSLLEQCGGDITVESELGRGTKFTVRLQSASQSYGGGSHRRRVVGDESEQAAFERVQKLAARSRPKVLVVDDEPFILRALRRALADEYEVTALESASDARTRLANGERFDAVLCDVVMPGTSGADLYEWIEASRPAMVPRVLFMSGGYPDARSRSLAERTPGKWLDKPFSEDEVRKRVAALVKATREVKEAL